MPFGHVISRCHYEYVFFVSGFGDTYKEPGVRFFIYERIFIEASAQGMAKCSHGPMIAI